MCNQLSINKTSFYLSFILKSVFNISTEEDGKKKKKGKKDTTEAEEAGFEVIDNQEEEGKGMLD